MKPPSRAGRYWGSEPTTVAKRVIAIAPAAPPCFSARQQWLEYLAAAAAEQRALHVSGPLLMKPGHETTFDHGFNFCGDCTTAHMHSMQRKGLCNPGYLTEIATAASEAAHP